MATINDTCVQLPEGCASLEAAVLLGNLGAVHQVIEKAVEALTPATLEWQSAPGSNTIGMLLTHIACAEVQFVQLYVQGDKEEHVRDVLGIGFEDEGMPAQPGVGPPAALAHKDVAFFRGLLDRALTHSQSALRGLQTGDFDRRTVIERPNGDQRIFNLRWLLFHAIEHAAAHFGQIQTLKRLAREAEIS